VNCLERARHNDDDAEREPHMRITNRTTGASANHVLTCSFIAVAGLAASHVNAQEYIHPLGLLAGGSYSVPAGISADGTVVVGRADSPPRVRGFHWTTGGGLEVIPDAVGTMVGGAVGVSGDGLVVAGNGLDAAARPSGYRWTAVGGIVWLPQLPPATASGSEAAAVSGDGSVVVGTSFGGAGPQSVRWTGAVPAVLGVLPGGTSSEARGVSHDGSVVGRQIRQAGQDRRCRWVLLCRVLPDHWTCSAPSSPRKRTQTRG